MNIFIRELKANRKPFIIWCSAMIFLIIAGMGKYSAGAQAGETGFNEFLKQMPESIQNLLGVGVFDLSKAMDYYAVLFIYIALVAVVHAVMLGAEIISKEERAKTAEFLLTKPVSRRRIITFKLLAALAIALLFNAVTSAASFLTLSCYSKGEPFMTDLSKLALALFALQLLFAGLGAFCAAVISRPRLSSAAATGIMLAMFLLSVVLDIEPDLDFLSFFTLFKYYDPKDILKRGYDLAYPVISSVLLALFTWGTYHFYRRRDLRL